MSQQHCDLISKACQLIIMTLATIIFYAFPTSADEVILNPDADSTISEIVPSSNFGTDDSLVVGSQFDATAGYNKEWNFLIKFNLSSLSGVTVNWVKLRLYCFDLQGQPWPYIYQATSSWTETGVTFSSEPTYDSRNVADDPVTSTGWYELYSEDFGTYDFARIVQEWIANPFSNYGLIFVGDTVVSSNMLAYFRSRDYSSSSYWPQLVINYSAADITLPIVTITTPTSSSTYTTSTSPLTLGGTASDNVGVTQVTWSNSATGASGTATGTTSWTVSGITLNSGTNVLTVTAKDAANNPGTDTLTVTYSESTGGQPTTSVPVVLVHGWCGSPDSFGEMVTSLSEDLNVAAVEPVAVESFDYSSASGFPDSIREDLKKLAAQLAIRIQSLAGPSGKVDVVAHSMGGLITRAWMAGLADVPYSGEIRRLVTAGTPHFGVKAGIFDRFAEELLLDCKEEIDEVLNTQAEQVYYGSQFLKELNEKWGG